MWSIDRETIPENILQSSGIHQARKLQRMIPPSATSTFLWEILSLPIRHSLREISHLYRENGLFAIVVHYDQLALSVTLSDIASVILYEKPAPYAKIGLHKTTVEWNGGMMAKLGEAELKMLVKGGEIIQLS